MTQTAFASSPQAHALQPGTDETMALSSTDESYLVSVIEAAHSIVRRHQFFLWARGVLQSLIPHEILLCGYGDWRRKQFSVDRFSGRPFPEAMYADICDNDDGLLMQAYTAWEANGHTPLIANVHDARQRDARQLPADAGYTVQIAEALKRHDIDNGVFCGLPQINGSPSAFFCFARMPAPVTRRTAYLIELVAPSLYTAHLRVLHGERRRDDPRAARDAARPRVALLPRAITGREVQILQWVQEGKSNREIGEVLKISPLTVKNHVQNILKKLKVRNRAQAVSRAIGARLIQSAAHNTASDRIVRPAQSELEP